MTSLLQQIPKGELLETCLPYYLKILKNKNDGNVQTESNNNNEEKRNNNEEKIISDDLINYTEENERTDTILNALEAISNLFFNENNNENGGNHVEISSAGMHVHSASCTHDHKTPFRYLEFSNHCF